ncbi:MAG: hypothetical protein HYZ53_02940 [Planctomycetes bacterium]|nr:hypothetical protein [Planctomycetota bacterium]
MRGTANSGGSAELRREIEGWIPSLRGTGCALTSPRDPEYNCVCYAAGPLDRTGSPERELRSPWWPAPPGFGPYYWPEGIERRESLEAFVQALATRGYSVCDSGAYEPEFEKAAIYSDKWGLPKHVARQDRHGRWRSKLGVEADIEHTLDALEPKYGEDVRFLKRRVAYPPQPPGTPSQAAVVSRES